MREDFEGLAAGNDTEKDLLGAERGLVSKVSGQALDVFRGDLRPDDGVPSRPHVFAAFSSARLARRRTSAVEWTRPLRASDIWLCARSFSMASVS